MDKKLILTSLIVSLFFGGAGGVGSFYLLNEFNSDEFPQNDMKQISVYTEESSLIEAIDKANPAVGSIIASKELERMVGGSPFSMFGNPWGMRFEEPEIITEKREIGGGTGFVVSEDGLMITNKHVVEDDEAEYSVFLSSGEQYFAKVLVRDPFNDIAVVQLYDDSEMTKKPTQLPFSDLGDSDVIEVGARVIAIGNALSEFDNTTTAGIVSGKGRQIVAGSGNPFSGEAASQLSGLIQTDASINPGNSGGPLINIFGEVIGMNTAVANANGIGFAIPVNDVKSVLESVKKYGEIVRPYIGVRFININAEIAEEFNLPSDKGAYLQDDISNRSVSVIPDGPADKAGLRSGDLIVSVDGISIDENMNLQRIVSSLQVGDKIEVEFYRDSELKKTELVLEKLED